MTEQFLNLIERVASEDASVTALFSSSRDGRGVRSARRRGPDPQYLANLAEAARFMAEIYEGKRPMYHLREAMTTDDFPQLFGDIIDRQMLASYRETPSTFRNYCKVATVRDFRTVSRKRLDGGEGALSIVPEQDEYSEVALTDDEYTYSVEKYGRKIPISWETLINDDLNAFKDLPERLGRAARRTEEKFATTLFADTNGPHASLYTAGNGNIVTGNPALSIAGLQTALQKLADQTDNDSEPIFIEAVELVVPPALEVTAMNVLNALQLEVTESGGTSAQKLVTANWMKGRFRLSVNYYLPIVSATADGDTAWYLFANPMNGRPALEVGFLQGHTEPEVFIKEPNQRLVGGGAVNPVDGDFDNDSVEYKVRHVIGGARLDPKMTVASEGDGT